jgi:hypothetical protein
VKLANFDLVARCVAARRSLIQQRDHSKFGVMIDGRYQDDEIIEAARPAIVAVLNRRIAELDEDLLAMGVVVDAEA